MANIHKPICLKTPRPLMYFYSIMFRTSEGSKPKHTKTHNKVRVHTKKSNQIKSKHKERNGLTTCMVVKTKRQQNVGN
jgi:hypothetical protein